MEDVQEQSLFSLFIDPETKLHLTETARWARFLAITGLVFLGLLVTGGLIYSIWVNTMLDNMQDRYGFQTPRNYGTGLAAGSAFMIIITAVIAFFPMLYMLRFANQMKTAIYGNDQERLNSSFQNLKRYFRYVGIITLIGLGFWLIWFLVIMVSLASVR